MHAFCICMNSIFVGVDSTKDPFYIINFFISSSFLQSRLAVKYSQSKGELSVRITNNVTSWTYKTDQVRAQRLIDNMTTWWAKKEESENDPAWMIATEGPLAAEQERRMARKLEM